jgi:hypothetical protein
MTRRLDENEKETLIRSGAVFVWEESDNVHGLKRWTGEAGFWIDATLANV